MLQRRGLTLIELVVATALAALLMAAVAGVMRSLVMQKKVLLSNDPPTPWKDRLRDQLRWDFANARRFSAEAARLRLVGYGGADFDTGALTQRPTEVVYETIDVGPRSWLVRREIHLDASTLHNRRSDIVCAGVRALVVRRIEEQPVDVRREPPAKPAAGSTPLSPVPDQLRLMLFGPDEETLLNEVLLLR